MSKRILKDDLVLIAQRRNEGTASSKWSKMKMPELKELILPLTSEEKKHLTKIKAKRADFVQLDNETIKKTLMMNGYGKGSQLSKSGKLDLINKTAMKPYKKFVPNEDQKRFLTRTQDKFLIVGSGPGSGKTSTLAAFGCQLAKIHP